MDLHEKIAELIEAERNIEPSSSLQSQIENAILASPESQKKGATYFVIQRMAAGLLILLCAALGALVVQEKAPKSLPTATPETIDFNEMKWERPESLLLK